MSPSADDLVARARQHIDRTEPRDLAAITSAGGLVVDIRPAAQRASEGDLPGALVEPLNTPVGAFRAGIQREQARHDPSVVAPPATMFLPPLERTELA